MERRRTTVTRVGTTAIGGDNPIRVQSMTTTNTNDTVACIEQAKRIVAAGGELVRLTTQATVRRRTCATSLRHSRQKA